MATSSDSGVNSAAVRLSHQRLAQIVPGDDPGTIIDALEPCMGVAAGLLMVVNEKTMSMTHTALRIPRPLFEGWMHTQPENLKSSLFPAVRSRPGEFWNDRDGLPDKLRRNMEVLHILDRYGLGEGAGLKLLRQRLPGGGEEHVVMALLTGRGQRFPLHAADISLDLAPALQAAVLRLGLPFTLGRSIHAHLLEDDAVGFVCLGVGSKKEQVIELNQRAYELAFRYREAAGVGPGRFSMHDFVEKALKKNLQTSTWQLVDPKRMSMMQVRAYILPKERYGLAHDMPILKLEEWSLPPLRQPEEFSVFDCLRPREREIAIKLVTTGLAPKEIAYELKIELKTVRKHIENLHKTLNVHSQGELNDLVRRSQN